MKEVWNPPALETLEVSETNEFVWDGTNLSFVNYDDNQFS